MGIGQADHLGQWRRSMEVHANVEVRVFVTVRVEKEWGLKNL